MIERLRTEPAYRGDAFHQLFMGRDTDEAEAAAQMLGKAVVVWLEQNTK